MDAGTCGMSSPDYPREAYFALTRNGNEIASATLTDESVSPADQAVPISELQAVGFSLTFRTPDLEYGVSIGDVPLPPGRAFGPNIYWEDGHHFESTRGRVRVHLRTRAAPGAGWRVCARLDVNVVPTKLGEKRYEALVKEIRKTRRGAHFRYCVEDVPRRALRTRLGPGRLAYEPPRTGEPPATVGGHLACVGPDSSLNRNCARDAVSSFAPTPERECSVRTPRSGSPLVDSIPGVPIGADRSRSRARGSPEPATFSSTASSCGSFNFFSSGFGNAQRRRGRRSYSSSRSANCGM